MSCSYDQNAIRLAGDPALDGKHPAIGRLLVIEGGGLTLQLPFCFEVRALSDGLVSSAPEGPCDGVCGLNPLSIKSDGNAANFLD